MLLCTNILETIFHIIKYYFLNYDYNFMNRKQHKDLSSNCTSSFPTETEMRKAFNVLIYDIDVCFSGIDDNTIMIPNNICKILEEKGIKFSHL